MKSVPPVHKVKGYLSGNIYIIEADDELVLVDTGVPQDYRLIVDRIKSLGRSPVEVGHIILTHFHVDHAGSAAAFRRVAQASVYAHKDEAPLIQGDESVSSVYKKGVLGRAVSIVPQTAAKATRVPTVEVDRPVEDGEVIPVLGGIRVFHTPGHTPGSACFLWEDQGILFTGDTIINTYHHFTLPTIGFSCDFDEAGRSACRLVDLTQEIELSLVCPGHGPLIEENPGEKLLRFRGRLMKKGVSS